MSLYPITSFDVYKNRISEKIRPFLITSQNGLPPLFSTVGEAFVEAANIIEPVIYVLRNIDFVFGSSPYKIPTTRGCIVYETSSETINSYMKDMIFIDCKKMIKYVYPIQVACILEELVHAFLNVKCEKLAMQIVCNLYNGIKCQNGQYAPS